MIEACLMPIAVVVSFLKKCDVGVVGDVGGFGNLLVGVA